MAVTSIEDLNARQKAAIVVITLGPDATGLMAQLGTQQIERLAEEFVGLGEIPDRVRDEVLAEFHNRLAVHRVSDGGLERAAKVLEASLGKEQAAQAVRRMEWRASQMLRGFAKADPTSFGKLLENEHPQASAFLLTQLEPEVSGRVIESLPEKVQLEMIWRIATMQPIRAEVAAAVHGALAPLYSTRSETRRPEPFGGENKAAGLLTMVGSSAQRLVLDTLNDMDGEVARRIRKLMFTFKDLLLLDDRGMQKLLKAVDTKILATALKNAEQAILDRVLKNLSERAGQTLQEEIQYMQSAKAADIEAARDVIIDEMRKLEESGEVVVDRTGAAQHGR